MRIALRRDSRNRPSPPGSCAGRRQIQLTSGMGEVTALQLNVVDSLHLLQLLSRVYTKRAEARGFSSHTPLLLVSAACPAFCCDGDSSESLARDVVQLAMLLLLQPARRVRLYFFMSCFTASSSAVWGLLQEPSTLQISHT